MGHLKISAHHNPDDIDPMQGFDVSTTYVDDAGKEHRFPATAVVLQIAAGRAVAVCQVTIANVELDLPGLDIEIVRDINATADETFDAQRTLRGTVRTTTEKLED